MTHANGGLFRNLKVKSNYVKKVTQYVHNFSTSPEGLSKLETSYATNIVNEHAFGSQVFSPYMLP